MAPDLIGSSGCANPLHKVKFFSNTPGRWRLGAQLFRKKDIDQLITDSEDPEKRLKKSLGWLSLTSLGIGAVIGSGIFTIVGTAIAGQTLQFKSVLNAPLLEYLIYHSASFGTPWRRPGDCSFICSGRRGLRVRGVCAMPNSPR